MQKVDKFRELYLTEQDEKLNIKSELKDCKVIEKIEHWKILYFVKISSHSNYRSIFQRNLETTHKLLEDLKEKYKMALSTLKVTYALKTKASSDLEELTSVMPAQVRRI